MVPLDEWVKWMVWARAMTEQFERERRELAAMRLRTKFHVIDANEEQQDDRRD
jgi:hypothetical protein